MTVEIWEEVTGTFCLKEKVSTFLVGIANGNVQHTAGIISHYSQI